MRAGRLAAVALVCSALVACGGSASGSLTTPTGGAPDTTAVVRTPTSDPVAGTTTVISTASSAPRGTTTTAPTRATVTTVPTCANPADRGPVTVLAASSMVNVLDELKDAWISSHPCITAVNISYGSSATLAAQVVSGAPADVFISASDATMNTVRNAGLAVIAPQVFARNKGAILLWPGGKFATGVSGVADLLDSANPGIKVGLCVASAPCGSLANTILSNARAAYSRADLTRANIADTEAASVEDLVTKVELGELDAGIAYLSDCVSASAQVLATCVLLPDSVNSANNYLVAGLNNRSNTAAFVSWVMSAQFGSTARLKYGFLSP